MKLMIKIITIIAVIALLGSLSSAKIQFNTNTILLTDKNTVNIRGPITDELMGPKAREIWFKEFASSGRPIYLIMDSPGGSIDAGLDFIESVKNTKNLHTVSLMAASMASGIVQQIPGNRYITSNGVHMYHRARGGFQGQFEGGEVESRLASAQYMVRQLLEIPNALRMGLSLETYKAKVKDEMWLIGKQAVENRSADAVITVRCSKDLINATERMTVRSIFGPVDIVFSRCPLLRMPIAVNFAGDQTKKNEAVNEAMAKLKNVYKNFNLNGEVK